VDRWEAAVRWGRRVKARQEWSGKVGQARMSRHGRIGLVGMVGRKVRPDWRGRNVAARTGVTGQSRQGMARQEWEGGGLGGQGMVRQDW
jgi:hypothetical protein